jgi:8-oxo-dGTP pyrophosphatase MutT (NUDIX family)
MNGDETSPFQTVSREVYEELGLSVYKIGGQVGPDHPFKIEKTGVVDIARIWRCKVTGQPQVSNEADAFGYFTEQTIRALTLVGPEGRLGRTGRMVWDGLSILRDPVDVRQFSVLYSVHEDDYVVSPDGLHLHHVIDRTISIWRRLDPYGTDGYMEAPKK